MAVTADQIVPAILPYGKLVLGYLFLFIEIFGVMMGIGYVIMLFTFNVKVVVHEYTKGGRTIIRTTKARESKNSKTGIPELHFMHPTIFFGKKINAPPNDCAFPYKGFMAKKAYCLILKDGMYYPVSNYIMGRVKEQYNEETKQTERLYSTEGTGLEVSRNYDHEQAIINKLHNSALQFRNKKPVELVAMYGIVVISILVAGVIMVYSLKKIGDLFTTLQTLREPIQNAVEGAISQKLGPG